MPDKKESVGVEPNVAVEMRIEKARTKKPIHKMIGEAWALYKSQSVAEKPASDLSPEDRSIIEAFTSLVRSDDDRTKRKVLPMLKDWQRKQELLDERAAKEKTSEKSAVDKRGVQTG